MKKHAFSLMLLTGFSLVACAAMPNPSGEKAKPSATIWQSLPGISGISPAGPNSYLTLHDSKGYKPDAPRLGLLAMDPAEDTYSYVPLTMDTPKDGPTSDLESGCNLEGRPGEYLINESGTWEMTGGRFYHVKLEGTHASLLHEDKVPFTRDNDPKGDFGDQYEGLACLKLDADTYILLLGERGGTEFTPNGIIKYGTYNAASRELIWTGGSVSIRAPREFVGADVRSITGLTIDDQNRLWASASVDAASELGPFRSVVYQVGRVQASKTNPVIVVSGGPSYVLDGLKIEAVSSGLGGQGLSVGSEDESFGGNWRQLPPK